MDSVKYNHVRVKLAKQRFVQAVLSSWFVYYSERINRFYIYFFVRNRLDPNCDPNPTWTDYTNSQGNENDFIQRKHDNNFLKVIWSEHTCSCTFRLSRVLKAIKVGTNNYKHRGKKYDAELRDRHWFFTAVNSAAWNEFYTRFCVSEPL